MKEKKVLTFDVNVYDFAKLATNNYNFEEAKTCTYKEIIDDKGRPTIICNVCSLNEYPKCTEWFPNAKGKPILVSQRSIQYIEDEQ